VHPEAVVSAALETAALHAHQAIIEAVTRALPPPTGPPALASVV